MGHDTITVLDALVGNDRRGTGASSAPVTVPDWAADAGSDAGTARAFELPAAHEMTTSIEDTLGGRAAAWSAGYRDGHEEGHLAGHAEGFAAGRADGAVAAVAEVTGRLDALAAAVGDTLAAEQRRIEELASDIVDLAVGLADAVVGHHVAAAEDPGAEALRRAIGAAPAGRTMLARLHPDDVAALRLDTAQLAPGRPLEVVADPAIARGDCVLEAGPTAVDATLAAALQRVRAVLADERSGGEGP
jgi:flagellar assembly protein FliH